MPPAQEVCQTFIIPFVSTPKMLIISAGFVKHKQHALPLAYRKIQHFTTFFTGRICFVIYLLAVYNIYLAALAALREI
jgi:hypothetical protein